MAMKISGRRVAIDKDRSVFVGRLDGNDSSFCIEFDNGGTVKRFTLSNEASVALVDLLTGAKAGKPKSYRLIDDRLDNRLEWQIVRPLNA